MKKIYQILSLVAVLGGATSMTSCVEESDINLPPYSPIIFNEDFEWYTQGNLSLDTWSYYVVQGTKPWSIETRNSNSYLIFTAYRSNEAVNEAWITSKDINIDEANLKKMSFISTQGYLRDVTNNDLDAFVITSTDTVKLNFNKPVTNRGNFYWVNSGTISLEQFTGTIKIAFKATGSGTDSNAGATYEVDNIKIF